MREIAKLLKGPLDDLPRLFLESQIDKKLEAMGRTLPKAARTALIDHILDGKGDGVLELADDDGPVEDTEPQITLTFGDEDLADLKAFEERASEAIPEAIERTLDLTAAEMFRDLKGNWEVESTVHALEVEGFQERLYERWGEGLDLLGMMLTLSREIGSNALRRLRRSRSRRHDVRPNLLARLHARACQVSEEIIWLLEGGFPDGAMGRWRTLHEISVVAAVIADGDEDLARRYVAHEVVEDKRAMDEQVRDRPRSMGSRRLKAIERAYAEALETYGKAFGTHYGWAAERLGKPKPNFRDLQDLAGHASMNIYYKFASYTVHAGSPGLFSQLGGMNRDILLSGRSNAGIDEPGRHLAYTLTQITGAFVGVPKSLDDMLAMKVMIATRDAVPRSLNRASRRLEQDQRGRERRLEAARAKRRAAKAVPAS